MNNDRLIQVQIFCVLAGAFIFVFFDSPWFATHYFVGQDINNVIMGFFYYWLFIFAKRRLQKLMLIMIIVSLCAEIIGSKVLTVYQYHLGNIPLFIPFGHAVTYATVYNLSRQPLIWKYHHFCESLFAKLAFLICSLSLFLLNDVAGFLGYLLFLVLIAKRKKPLFYLTMFLVTYYLEFAGTISAAWSYYFVLGNHPDYPSTSITPCGIAGIYMIVDIMVNTIYLYLKKFKSYFRKQIRKGEFSTVECPG